MIEQNEEVVEETTGSVEETTEDNTEQPIEEVVEEIDESKFDSAGNDAVIKVDLDKSPSAKNVEENITKVNVDEKTTEETVDKDIPVIEEITVEDLKDKEVLEEKVEEAVEEALKEVTTTTVTDSALSLSQTESYAQNNTLDQLVSTEMWNLFDADPPKSIYPEDLRRIEVLQTKLSDIYPEVQITSIYDEQTYQYHEKYCKEYNITECSLPYIIDEHSYVTTTTLP